MEMFDLTKNHKGDILISGATSNYSGSWMISETQEAAESPEPPGPCDRQESFRPPYPDPKHGPDRLAHTLPSMETDPGSLNNLYSQLRSWGRGGSPSHQEEKTLGVG